MADNPFSGYKAILDPNQPGTIMGAIGGLMGAPTRAQAQGSATGRALQELSALKQRGASNQQALMQWFQTPSGQDYFTNAGPDGLKTLADGLTSMTPPAPTVQNVPEGGQLYSVDASGKPTLAASNPRSYAPSILKPGDQAFDRSGNMIGQNTNPVSSEDPADVKSFKFFTKLAGLPSVEIKKLAALKADPTPNDPNSVKNQAIERLVRNYGLDPQLADAIRADTIKVIPMKNDTGQDTGDVMVYDLANPSGGAKVIRQSASSDVAPAPGSTPAAGGRAGVLPPAPSASAPSAVAENPAFGSKDDMALGAGPVSKVLGAATTMSEAVDPSLIIEQGAQAKDRQTMLGALRSNLQALGTVGGGLGSNKALIEGYTKTYLDDGFFTSSPHSQVSKLIRLHEKATQHIEEETQRARNKSLPNEVKKNAQEFVAGWQRVLSSMPSYETLVKQEAAIRAGTAGAPTVGGAAKTLVEGASRALTKGKQQADEASSALPKGVDIDKIPDAELFSVEIDGLDRASKIKLLRRLEALQKRGKRSSVENGEFQVAGDVVPLHPPGTFARNTDSGDIINGVARRLNIAPPNNVTPFRRPS